MSFKIGSIPSPLQANTGKSSTCLYKREERQEVAIMAVLLTRGGWDKANCKDSKLVVLLNYLSSFDFVILVLSKLNKTEQKVENFESVVYAHLNC
jgi:hypothetical protein